MAVQDQRAAALMPWAARCDHVQRISVVDHDGGEARMTLDLAFNRLLTGFGPAHPYHWIDF